MSTLIGFAGYGITDTISLATDVWVCEMKVTSLVAVFVWRTTWLIIPLLIEIMVYSLPFCFNTV